MTTRICHVFDEQTSWEQRQAVRQLVDKLSPDGFEHHFVTIAPQAARALGPLARPIRRLTAPFGVPFLASPQLRRFLAGSGAHIVHAWGVQAALAARVADSLPVVLHLFDPAAARRSSRLLRTLDRPGKFAVVCSAELVRRRLVEGGLPLARCAVIRPGVDFDLINKCRRGSLRESLGLSRQHIVIALPETGPRDLFHSQALSGSTFANHYILTVRFLVRGKSRATARLKRMERTWPTPNIITVVPADVPYEAALAVSDVLVVPPMGDISTTCIAWAMAANVRVVGSATYAVAELIGDKLNGRLFKPVRGESVAIPIARLLLESDGADRLADVARGHAYEVFGVARCAKQHAQLYENVLAGRPPADGLVDSAVVT